MKISQNQAIHNVCQHYEASKHLNSTMFVCRNRIFWLKERTGLLQRIQQVCLNALQFCKVISRDADKITTLHQSSITALKKDPIHHAVLHIHRKSVSAQREVIRQQRNELIDKKDTFEADVRVKQKELGDKQEAFNQKVEAKERELALQEGEIEEKRQLSEQLQASIQKLQATQQELETKLAPLQEQVKLAEEQLQQYEVKANNFAEFRQEWMTARVPEHQCLVKAIALIKKQERQIATLQREHAVAQAKVEQEKNEELKELGVKISDLNKELGDAKAKIAAMEEEFHAKNELLVARPADQQQPPQRLFDGADLAGIPLDVPGLDLNNPGFLEEQRRLEALFHQPPQ